MGIKHLLTASTVGLAITLGAVTANAQSGQPAAPVVAIDSGKVDGAALPSGVQAYLGIPYAAPPVRDLRWREPQPVQPWQGVFHADRYGPQCTQPQRNPRANQYSGAEITSEDCLYLNVWTKPGLKKAPVIVYIHGGAFFIGAANMPLYAGESVANKDAVFVNLNYRLGVLGFLAHPELTSESATKSSGNYAFLDQIAALKWIQKNIAQFGGDPENVTIVGQSAGASAVMTLQSSPLAKGLIHRAIGMSGGGIALKGPGRGRSLANGESEGLKYQQAVKTNNLAEMRALPADRLATARTPTAPVIGPVQDGYVLPDRPEGIFLRSQQNDVPLIVGFTRDESFGGFGEVKDLADYRAKATARFGDRAAEYLKLYPAANDAEAKSQAHLADRDSGMVLGMSGWARAQSTYGRAPVYTYEFVRAHSYAPGVSFSDLDPATAGAYHTSEVPFFLGTLDSFNRFRTTRAWTPADREFSGALTDSLVAFARTGNPTTSELKWPKYDPRSPKLIELGGATNKVSPWPDQRKLEFFSEQPRVGGPAGAPRD